ncbi:uncharacterized protein ACBT44_004164 [Syngnathus typhle]
MYETKSRRLVPTRPVSGVQRKESPKESSRQVMKRSLTHDWPRLTRGLPGQGMGRASACTERDRAAPTRPGRGQAEDESNPGRSRPGPWPVTSGEAGRAKRPASVEGEIAGAADRTSACTERDWTGARDQRLREAEDEARRRAPAERGPDHRPTFARDERPTTDGRTAGCRCGEGKVPSQHLRRVSLFFPLVLSFFPSLPPLFHWVCTLAVCMMPLSFSALRHFAILF